MSQLESKDKRGWRDILLQRSGPLTQKLVRNPGKFGLGQVPASSEPNATTTAICGYCSTGCGLTVHVKNGEAVGLSPDPEYPVNLGMACPKGWEALKPLVSDERGTIPLIKDRHGNRKPVEWDKALKIFCSRIKEIQDQHGKDSVAFLSTGQIPSEEMALLGALTKFGMGIVHGDGNTRQCMASAVVAYKQSYGFDAPPYTYQDFEESDVIVLVGSNLCIAHPIMWQRIARNPHSPEIVVIDPRTTETAVAGTKHYPIKPKSDLEFFYGVANGLINAGFLDNDFIEASTTEFQAFKEFVSVYTPDKVEKASGIAPEQLDELVRLIGEGKRVSFWWTMGVNQSYEGVRVAQSLINLSLMTGNIGRPGTGANSITGQCNAMGSRLFSNTTNLLGGHGFGDADDRAKVSQILGMDESLIPDNVGKPYDKIIEGIIDGKIKALWVIATNPLHSWINQEHLEDVMSRLDFLVVQDMYHSTETAVEADLFLPAAGWGEKEGSFINSERRIGLLKKTCKAPGQALADFSIFKLIAEYWGCSELFKDWQSPAVVFQILKRLSKDQPCDFSGVRDYQMLDELGGIQWPFTSKTETPETQRRLFEDGVFYHPDGKAKFIFEPSRGMPEPLSSKYPFMLLTGRGSSSQWHTQTRTAKAPLLQKLYSQTPYVEIHPNDARELNIKPDTWVRLDSRRGGITLKAFVTTTVDPGQLFVPMHYKITNKLTHASFDPYSRQPSYKACAVNLRAKEHWEEVPTND